MMKNEPMGWDFWAVFTGSAVFFCFVLLVFSIFQLFAWVSKTGHGLAGFRFGVFPWVTLPFARPRGLTLDIARGNG